MSQFELHESRLATTDETGRRVFLYPADVRGRYRRRRNIVQFFLIIFFLVLPWVRINGRQAVLLDIAHREFEIFGLSLRAHNAPLLVFVFAIAGFGLFFATAIWGRIWCGWACPQTVFIDGVFRRIERWIEGPALERRRLADAPWTFKKIKKRVLKWALYLVAALIITHSFLAYFVGTERLAGMVTSSPFENWGSFLFIVIATAIIYFDFTWFREQFCIIACPYGRFQSVLMDSHSMIVAYDAKRGEPRATPAAKAKAKAGGPSLGDCVNCYRCVQVCPTGIDIRRGVQLECIACTSCIDACDEVMTKLKKPTGLIRYESLRGLEGKPRHNVRPRTILYFTLLSLAITGLSLSLAKKPIVEVAVVRALEAPYRYAGAGAEAKILNHFKIRLSNQSRADRNIHFEVDEEARRAGVELVTALRPYPLKAGMMTQVDVFIHFPREILQEGERKIRIGITDEDTKTGEKNHNEKEITLVGPFN